jgi:glyoxylase-like metal-dependent hydrolase (beta-lactamase superfamily II)
MLKVTSILGNSQRLDGGAMFGNAPRALWQTWLPPDAEGRVPLVCRALLVEDGTKNILLETGIGSFFEPKYKGRFGVVESEHVLLDSLAAVGLSHEQIDVVVVSHLHFDHAGGLLAAFVEGEPQRLLFPRATFVVGQTAWSRAQNPHPRDRASFIAELPELLKASGRLCIVDDTSDSTDLLGTKFCFRTSHGHTPGMLHTELRGQQGRLFFCADLIPGVPWLHVPITMGYDRFPERLIDEKLALYDDVLSHDIGLFFTHDPATALAFVQRSDKGRIVPRQTFHELRGWDLDQAKLPPVAGC